MCLRNKFKSNLISSCRRPNRKWIIQAKDPGTSSQSCHAARGHFRIRWNNKEHRTPSWPPIPRSLITFGPFWADEQGLAGARQGRIMVCVSAGQLTSNKSMQPAAKLTNANRPSKGKSGENRRKIEGKPEGGLCN